MTARDIILQRVRANRPTVMAPLPDVQTIIGAFPQPVIGIAEQFIETARASGAEVIEQRHSESHDFTGVDVFTYKAVLGVAENGAVWLSSSCLGADRSAAFLSERVMVLLDRATIVPNLHAAYAQLDIAAEPFGMFMAGPSKTADIEQSLVIGAHGPKHLTIMLF